jgi:hypothetical protein
MGNIDGIQGLYIQSFKINRKFASTLNLSLFS